MRKGHSTSLIHEIGIAKMNQTFKFMSIGLALSLATCFRVAAGDKIGVLILAHGSTDTRWEEMVRKAAEKVGQQYPLEIAFGMADPTTMQEAIDKLEAQGVTRIVAVPLFISSHSPIIRQNEYLLGLRKKLADEPMMMQHSSESHTNHYDSLAIKIGFPVIKPLRMNCKVILAKPLDDSPLVAEILEDRINELSREPQNETVILVAHGPNDEEDNKLWVKTMESLADQIYRSGECNRSKFKQIFCVTVRDDAKKDLYNQAREYLRSLVQQSGKNGDVIVIPVFLAQGGVESKVVQRLEALKYKWSGKTLLPHVNISRFITESVQIALQ